jgi:hypothetical protein
VRWNRRSLLTACEALIKREDVEIRLATVDPSESTAHVQYAWSKKNGTYDVRITLDPSQGGLIESLLHECLHVVLDREIESCFNKPLEEAIIKALERDLYVKAMKKADVARWRQLINFKLEEEEND